MKINVGFVVLISTIIYYTFLAYLSMRTGHQDMMDTFHMGYMFATLVALGIYTLSKDIVIFEGKNEKTK